jgi:hypothetical protein
LLLHVIYWRVLLAFAREILRSFTRDRLREFRFLLHIASGTS